MAHAEACRESEMRTFYGMNRVPDMNRGNRDAYRRHAFDFSPEYGDMESTALGVETTAKLYDLERKFRNRKHLGRGLSSELNQSVTYGLEELQRPLGSKLKLRK